MGVNDDTSEVLIEHPDMTKTDLKGLYRLGKINQLCHNPIYVLVQLTKQGDMWRKIRCFSSLRKLGNQVLQVFIFWFCWNEPD